MKELPDSRAAERPETRLLLTIVYDSGMDERVMETLTEAGITGWTKTFHAHGAGGVGRKLDTPIWPGTNHILYIVAAPAKVQALAAALRALQQTYRRNPGLMLWAHPVTLY